MNNSVESAIGSVSGMVPEQYAQYSGFVIVLVAVLLLGLMAIYSYKIFRIALTLGGTSVFGVLGCFLIAPFLQKFITVPEEINFAFAIGFVCAIIGGLLMNLLFKFALFVSGAIAGWLLGTTVINGILVAIFPTVEFFGTQLGALVIDAVCAIIVGVLSLFLFKFVYIISTSLGGMIGAALLIVLSIKKNPGTPAMMLVVLIGLIAGIIAAVKQFKSSESHHNNIENNK